MFCLFICLTRSLVNSFEIYDSCYNEIYLENVICVTPKEMKTYQFPFLLTDSISITIKTYDVQTIDFSSLAPSEIKSITLKGFKDDHRFVLDVNSLPSTLEKLTLGTLTLFFKEPAIINFYLDVIDGVQLQPSEANKITRGFDFKASYQLEKSFGIDNYQYYQKGIIMESCDDYSTFYKYKCIRADSLELENYEDFNSYNRVVPIYIATDVSPEHPIRFYPSKKSFNLRFIGRKKSEGKYQVTLDKENWDYNSIAERVEIINVNLSFSPGTGKIPIKEPLNLESINLIGCSIADDQCKVIKLSEITQENFLSDSLKVYECLGIRTEVTLVISNNCGYAPKGTICKTPSAIHEIYEKPKGIKKLNIILESDSYDIFYFNFSQFKLDVVIKAGYYSKHVFYANVDSMESGISSLNVKYINLHHRYTDSDKVFNFNFPVTYYEVNAYDGCGRIRMTGGFTSDRDFSDCFIIEPVIYPFSSIEGDDQQTSIIIDNKEKSLTHFINDNWKSSIINENNKETIEGGDQQTSIIIDKEQKSFEQATIDSDDVNKQSHDVDVKPLLTSIENVHKKSAGNDDNNNQDGLNTDKQNNGLEKNAIIGIAVGCVVVVIIIIVVAIICVRKKK